MDHLNILPFTESGTRIRPLERKQTLRGFIRRC